MSLDRRYLIGVVAQEIGIQIREDDPIFACVLLNQWALNTLLDEGLERVKPAFVSHENELKEIMRRSLIEISEKEKSMRQSSLIMSNTLDQAVMLLGIIAAAFIAISIVLTVLISSKSSLSDSDQQALRIGVAVVANCKKLDKNCQEVISHSIRK